MSPFASSLGCKKSLDKRYTYMITSVMLARRITLLDPLPTTLTPLLRYSCALLNSLAPLFRAPVLCFQSFAHSLTKTPGWGVPLQPSRASQVTSNPGNHRFLSSVFSCSCELLFYQLLCFHNHLRCPMVFPKRSKNKASLPIFKHLNAPFIFGGAKTERPGAYLRGVANYEPTI
jgi:hypothetical protein